MAGTTTTSRDNLGHPSSANRDHALQHNKVIADLEVLRAGLAALAAKFNAVLTKLDSDAGVTDTNYSATNAVTVTSYDAASDLTAAKIGNLSASAFTE